jgi:heterodisulfide reductase subunit D
MRTATTIEDVQYAASICLKCGSCTYGDWPENHHLCSLYYRDECFTHGGGGFMSIVTGLAENLLKFDQRIADLAYTCSGCLACDSRCSIISAHPPQVGILDMVRLLRFEAVKRGMVPKGIASLAFEGAEKKGDLTNDAGLKLPTEIESSDAKTVIFSECAHSEAAKDILAATARVLAKIGSPVSSFEEKGCCGSTLYDYGFWDEMLPLMKANWERMKGLGEKEFVFTNPHCEEFISKRYAENLVDFTGIDHRHISQVLSEALKNGTLKSKQGKKVKVSYHDPCYLGRGLGIYDAPRDVLTALDGVELVEMTRNRKSAFCCGARALGEYFPDHSGEMARERMREFEATGADVLITACPYCRENFRRVASDGKKDRIKDIVEFVDDRV